MDISFQPSAFNDFIEWSEKERKTFSKINKLIKEILRTPYEGIGDPEPLKYSQSGYWSRRISLEHRLVYEVTEETIIIISCKGHYT